MSAKAYLSKSTGEIVSLKAFDELNLSFSVPPGWTPLYAGDEPRACLSARDIEAISAAALSRAINPSLSMHHIIELVAREVERRHGIGPARTPLVLPSSTVMIPRSVFGDTLEEVKPKKKRSRPASHDDRVHTRSVSIVDNSALWIGELNGRVFEARFERKMLNGAPGEWGIGEVLIRRRRRGSNGAEYLDALRSRPAELGAVGRLVKYAGGAVRNETAKRAENNA